jgi:hypothetical protein
MTLARKTAEPSSQWNSWGESTAVIFKSILDETPVSPLRLNPELPTALEPIVFQALEKDRNLRYQSAADLRSDLARLKRDLDSGRSGSAAEFCQRARCKYVWGCS